MRNIENRNIKADSDALAVLLTAAKKEERRDRALAVSIRLEAIAAHAVNCGMNGIEVVELIRREAMRYENESQELH